MTLWSLSARKKASINEIKKNTTANRGPTQNNKLFGKLYTKESKIVLFQLEKSTLRVGERTKIRRGTIRIRITRQEKAQKVAKLLTAEDIIYSLTNKNKIKKQERAKTNSKPTHVHKRISEEKRP